MLVESNHVNKSTIFIAQMDKRVQMHTFTQTLCTIALTFALRQLSVCVFRFVFVDEPQINNNNNNNNSTTEPLKDQDIACAFVCADDENRKIVYAGPHKFISG